MSTAPIHRKGFSIKKRLYLPLVFGEKDVFKRLDQRENQKKR